MKQIGVFEADPLIENGSGGNSNIDSSSNSNSNSFNNNSLNGSFNGVIVAPSQHG